MHYDFVQIRSHAIVILGKVELSTYAFTRVHGAERNAHGTSPPYVRTQCEIILVRMKWCKHAHQYSSVLTTARIGTA